MFKNFRNSILDYVDRCSVPEIDDGIKALSLLDNDPRAFYRDNLAHHFTGSAAILDRETRKYMLMTLHAKAGVWLHLGGHCDGLPNPFVTAWTEAHEESGLSDILPLQTSIFDIDVHVVDKYRDVPEHLHCDIRYLFTANRSEPLKITSESTALEWVPVSEILSRNSRPIVKKLVDKILDRW